MTSYSDALFLGVFLPLTLIFYNILPHKHRWKLLLIASYLFFWSISGKLIIFIMVTTLLIHYFGLWLSSIQKDRDEELKNAQKEEKKGIRAKYIKKQRKVVGFSALCIIGTLVVVKYTSFIGTNINLLLENFGISFQFRIPKFLMPIGISFYSLQAMSYIFDVYRGVVKADKNLGRLALWLSFFPQIIEGPICRYSETAESLWKCERTSYKAFSFGLQRMGYGLLKQMVVANRLNALVTNIFDNYANYDGGIIAVRYGFIYA